MFALRELRDERAGAIGVAPAGDLIGGDDEHASPEELDHLIAASECCSCDSQ